MGAGRVARSMPGRKNLPNRGVRKSLLVRVSRLVLMSTVARKRVARRRGAVDPRVVATSKAAVGLRGVLDLKVARGSVRDTTRVLAAGRDAAVASGVNSRVVQVAVRGASLVDTHRIARRARAAALESNADSNTGETVLGVTRAVAVVQALEVTRVAEVAQGLGVTRAAAVVQALGAMRVVEVAQALEGTRAAEGARALEVTRAAEAAQALEVTRAVVVAQARGMVAPGDRVGSNLTGAVQRASGSRKHPGASGLESDANLG